MSFLKGIIPKKYANVSLRLFLCFTIFSLTPTFLSPYIVFADTPLSQQQLLDQLNQVPVLKNDGTAHSAGAQYITQQQKENMQDNIKRGLVTTQEDFDDDIKTYEKETSNIQDDASMREVNNISTQTSIQSAIDYNKAHGLDTTALQKTLDQNTQIINQNNARTNSLLYDPGTNLTPLVTTSSAGCEHGGTGFVSSGYYCLLTGLGNFFPGNEVNIRAGTSAYLSKLYQIGVAVATGLALIYITIGGVQYASTDSFTGSLEGRKTIGNALFGLGVVLSSYILLNAINPRLLENNLSLQPVGQFDSVSAGAPSGFSGDVTTIRQTLPTDVVTYDENGNALKQTAPAGFQTGGTPDGTVASNLVQTAENSIGSTSCNTSDTGNGKLACAAVVNDIYTKVTGSPIVNSNGTADMFATMKQSNNFSLVTGSLSQAQPGDIIISPTQGSNIGHVGIVETAGGASIISNSSGNDSTAASVQRNFTMSGWVNYYNTQKGLPVYIFRPVTH